MTKRGAPFDTEHHIEVEIFGINCRAYFTLTRDCDAVLDRVEVGLERNGKWEHYTDLLIDGAAILEADGAMTTLRSWLEDYAEKHGCAQDWHDDNRIFA